MSLSFTSQLPFTQLPVTAAKLLITQSTNYCRAAAGHRALPRSGPDTFLKAAI